MKYFDVLIMQIRIMTPSVEVQWVRIMNQLRKHKLRTEETITQQMAPAYFQVSIRQIYPFDYFVGRSSLQMVILIGKNETSLQFLKNFNDLFFFLLVTSSFVCLIVIIYSIKLHVRWKIINRGEGWFKTSKDQKLGVFFVFLGFYVPPEIFAYSMRKTQRTTAVQP